MAPEARLFGHPGVASVNSARLLKWGMSGYDLLDKRLSKYSSLSLNCMLHCFCAPFWCTQCQVHWYTPVNRPIESSHIVSTLGLRCQRAATAAIGRTYHPSSMPSVLLFFPPFVFWRHDATTAPMDASLTSLSVAFLFFRRAKTLHSSHSVFCLCGKACLRSKVHCMCAVCVVRWQSCLVERHLVTCHFCHKNSYLPVINMQMAVLVCRRNCYHHWKR